MYDRKQIFKSYQDRTWNEEYDFRIKHRKSGTRAGRVGYGISPYATTSSTAHRSTFYEILSMVASDLSMVSALRLSWARNQSCQGRHA